LQLKQQDLGGSSKAKRHNPTKQQTLKSAFDLRERIKAAKKLWVREPVLGR
jgi:hypothetical protein